MCIHIYVSMNIAIIILKEAMKLRGSWKNMEEVKCRVEMMEIYSTLVKNSQEIIINAKF